MTKKISIEFGQLIYVRTSDGSGVPGMRYSGTINLPKIGRIYLKGEKLAKK